MTKLKHGKGAIPWMASNPVAANLLLLLVIAGGAVGAFTITQEVFPEIDLDIVQINVPYPGASPAEVEQGIVLVVEEAVRGIDGVKKVSSNAAEGIASITVELELDTNSNKALADIKNSVDRITSLPKDAERPTISQLTQRRQVISIIVYGDLGERQLRTLSEKIRDDLMRETDITLVELFGLRPPEISVEVSSQTLRTYGLTLEGIATEVARESIDLPGGGVKTDSGEVLLRTTERRDHGHQFGEIELVSTQNGAKVKLSDIASVKDHFADTDESAVFNGQAAAMIKVFRTGEQTPMDISEAVHTYVERIQHELPPGVRATTWLDSSEIYKERFDLLLRNAYIGLALVLFLLGLLLEIRLAFWVTIGIPVSFLGSFLFIPVYDVTINMISLFAFILTLGMVVDDAIVVGENVYEYRRRGMPFLKAAIQGCKDVALPVVFSVLTTMAAFTPMLFVPGMSGKMFRVIPAVVISILMVSLIESLFVLPSHLAHLSKGKKTGPFAWITVKQQRISNLFTWLAEKTYAPTLRFALRHRYLTIATGVAMLVLTVGFLAGGRMGFSFIPRIDSDLASATAVLPFGVSIDQTKKLEKRIIDAAEHVLEEHGGKRILRGIYSQVGKPIDAVGPHDPLAARLGGSHLVTVRVLMQPSDKRNFSSAAFVTKWRARIGEVVGVESLTFNSEVVPTAGDAIDIQLSHPDMNVLKGAAKDLGASIATFEGVYDINEGFSLGKPRLDFKLKDKARSLGLTAMDLARQVRSAFYGAEALRQQRGRDEIKVMVRLPEEERRSEYDVEELILRTRNGGEVPITDAALVKRSRSFTEIKRLNGHRVVDVTADVNETITNANKVYNTLKEEVLPGLIARYPGLTLSREGQNREMTDSLKSLMIGFGIALLAIYCLLAIPLGSYTQPFFVVMAAIPYGIVGSVVGLVITGYDMSFIAVMGIVALSGVMVNSSLVLVYTANQMRDEGATPWEAIYKAGIRRFRPIVLTSLTTFAGLAPMIFETSVQARFLIPMAVTLGFGVLFGTFVTLGIVPALFMALEDIKAAFSVRDKRAVLEDSLDTAEESP